MINVFGHSQESIADAVIDEIERRVVDGGEDLKGAVLAMLPALRSIRPGSLPMLPKRGTPPAPSARVTPAERAILIKALITVGIPLAEIERGLGEGMTLYDGRTMKAGRKAWLRIVEDIAADAAALEASAPQALIARRNAIEGLERDAAAAEAAGDASTALRARLAVLDHTYGAAPMQLGTVEQRIAAALGHDAADEDEIAARYAQASTWEPPDDEPPLIASDDS